nr:MAG TPA: hypothetical protein [Caudoviricetes sp.]
MSGDTANEGCFRQICSFKVVKNDDIPSLCTLRDLV